MTDIETLIVDMQQDERLLTDVYRDVAREGIDTTTSNDFVLHLVRKTLMLEGHRFELLVYTPTNEWVAFIDDAEITPP